LLIALINLAVLEDVTDNSFPGNLINVAVETTIVAVNVLKRVNSLLIVAVDVAEADNVLNRVSNLLIVAVDVVDTDIVLNSVKSLFMVAVVADVTENDLTYLNILEMVLVLVDVADNVGVRVIVSSALIATLFTLDPFIAIFN
jgi:hypothetical protein